MKNVIDLYLLFFSGASADDVCHCGTGAACGANSSGNASCKKKKNFFYIFIGNGTACRCDNATDCLANEICNNLFLNIFRRCKWG